MNGRIWFGILIAAAITSAVAVHFARSQQQLAAEIHPHTVPAALTSTSVPEHVVYGLLFRNVARNNERNLELLNKRAVTAKYFAFKRELGFTAEQSRLVTEIAANCEIQVRQMDHSAQLIIAEFRSKLPKTKDAPPPPPQLKTMWEERNAMILAARDRLRMALGSETFDRLDNFAKFRYGTNKAPVVVRALDGGAIQDSESRVR